MLNPFNDTNWSHFEPETKEYEIKYKQYITGKPKEADDEILEVVSEETWLIQNAEKDARKAQEAVSRM